VNKEIADFVKSILVLSIVIVSYILSLYRLRKNTEYANKYGDNTFKLLTRLMLTWLIKGLCLLMLFGIIKNKIDIFIVFYVMMPSWIALNLLLFRSQWMSGLFIVLKGVYYLGVIVVSAIQFFLKSDSMTETAIGFTMALAIFESVTALSDGIEKMCNNHSV